MLSKFYDEIQLLCRDKYLYYFLFLLVLAAAVYLIFWKVSWITSDNFQIEVIFNGDYLFGWTGEGRWWPLGLFDYNIVKLFNITFGEITPFYVHNTIVMVVSSFMFFNLLNNIDKNNYALSFLGMLFLFSCSSFLMVHMDCIFSEHFMFFMLGIFMLCYWKGLKEQNSIFYSIALLAASYAVFCKEPAFLIFCTIGCLNILFKWQGMTKKDKWFNILLVTVAAAYLLSYAYHVFFVKGFLSYVYEGGSKIDDPSLIGKTLFSAPISVIIYMLKKIFLKTEPFLILFFVLAAIRFFFVFIKKEKEHLFFDGLLFSAVAYSSVFIYLLMSYYWYTMPAIILGVPVIVYWINTLKKEHWNGHGNLLKVCLMVASFACAIGSGALSKGAVKYRLRLRNEAPKIAEQILKFREKPIVLVSDNFIFNGINFIINCKLGKKEDIIQKVDRINEDTIPNDALVVIANTKVDKSKLKDMGFSLIWQEGDYRMYHVNPPKF